MARLRIETRGGKGESVGMASGVNPICATSGGLPASIQRKLRENKGLPF